MIDTPSAVAFWSLVTTGQIAPGALGGPGGGVTPGGGGDDPDAHAAANNSDDSTDEIASDAEDRTMESPPRRDWLGAAPLEAIRQWQSKPIATKKASLCPTNGRFRSVMSTARSHVSAGSAPHDHLGLLRRISPTTHVGRVVRQPTDS
jgi:hypothetical protein